MYYSKRTRQSGRVTFYAGSLTLKVFPFFKCLQLLVLFYAGLGDAYGARRGHWGVNPGSDSAPIGASNNRALHLAKVYKKDLGWAKFHEEEGPSPFSPDVVSMAFSFPHPPSTHLCRVYVTTLMCQELGNPDIHFWVKKTFQLCFPLSNPLGEFLQAHEGGLSGAAQSVADVFEKMSCRYDPKGAQEIFTPDDMIKEAQGDSKFLYIDFKISPSALGVIQNYNALMQSKLGQNGSTWEPELLLATRLVNRGETFLSNNARKRPYTCDYMKKSLDLMGSEYNYFKKPLFERFKDLKCP